MRKPKRKEFHDVDTFHSLYRSHGNANAVTVHVTESETTGKLIVEIIGGKGDVELRFAPEAVLTPKIFAGREIPSTVLIRGSLVGSRVVFCKLGCSDET